MTAKQKILKKRKLRNAEYYDFQSVQDELYAKSMKNANFQNLMQYVLMEENIKLAYRNIKKNDGSKTAGVDDRTIKNLAKLDTNKLIKIVRDKLVWYTPQAIRRVEIPKDNNPLKKRPLGIPTINVIPIIPFREFDCSNERKYYSTSAWESQWKK